MLRESLLRWTLRQVYLLIPLIFLPEQLQVYSSSSDNDHAYRQILHNNNHLGNNEARLILCETQFNRLVALITCSLTARSPLFVANKKHMSTNLCQRCCKCVQSINNTTTRWGGLTGGWWVGRVGGDRVLTKTCLKSHAVLCNNQTYLVRDYLNGLQTGFDYHWRYKHWILVANLKRTWITVAIG